MRSMLFALAAVVLVSAPSVAQERANTTQPVLIKEVKPVYTAAAKARKVQGMVEMSVLVQIDGTPGQDIRVVRSLDPDLDQQAIKAVRQWRFKPGTKDGQPVPIDVMIEMSFTLRDGPLHKVGDDGVTAPEATTHPNPQYTQSALDRHIQGAVQLSGVVETDGSVSSIALVKGLDDELDQRAIDAFKQWRFKPGQKNGAPARVEVNVEMTFTVR